jgi:hypothetical protein
MPLIHVTYEPADVSFEQSTREKLTKFARQLRWSGFEKEADRIQLILDGAALDQSSPACRMADLAILRAGLKTLKELSSKATLTQSDLGALRCTELSVARLATNSSTLQ